MIMQPRSLVSKRTIQCATRPQNKTFRHRSSADRESVQSNKSTSMLSMSSSPLNLSTKRERGRPKLVCKRDRCQTAGQESREGPRKLRETFLHGAATMRPVRTYRNMIWFAHSHRRGCHHVQLLSWREPQEKGKNKKSEANISGLSTAKQLYGQIWFKDTFPVRNGEAGMRESSSNPHTQAHPFTTYPPT